jgi:hypothetical protein
VQFQGPATAFSTTNAADYLPTTGPVVFINNAGTSFAVMGALPTVTITAPDPNASEVPSTDVGKFGIARTGDTTGDLRVSYTIGGTATNGVDYRMLRNNATIRSGRTFVAIKLQPIDDTISEPDETAILTLSPDPNYIIGSPSTATVTIHSNE